MYKKKHFARRYGVVLYASVLILCLLSRAAYGANAANNYIGPASGSLNTPSNWSAGHLPTVSEDAVFTALTGIRTLTAANLTVGSFDVTANSGTFSIRNETNGSTNSLLTLGGAGDLGNGVAPNSADLLYVASGATFNIRADNPTGTGTLNLVLGQSGNFDAVGTLAISSVISDGGSGFGFSKTGAGTLTLSATNSYGGGTTVQAGTLLLSGAGTLGSTAGTLAVNGGTLNLNATNQTVGALNGSGGIVTNDPGSTNAGSTLTIGSGNASGSYSGIITDIATGNRTLALTKIGTGTETLTGNNGYRGTTTINGGTLNAGATNALANTSGIIVNNTGTLAISGSGNLNRINNSAGITLAGGTLARSGTGAVSEGVGAHRSTASTVTGTSSVGFSALTLTANSGLDFGPGGIGTLVFSSFTPNGHILDILNYTSSASGLNLNVSGTDGTDDRLIFNQNQSGNLANFSFNGISATEIALDSGFWEIVPVTPVPEPSTWIAAALALGAIGYSQRKRLRVRRGA